VISGLTALGRYATPADIAATVGHLAGGSARNITGREHRCGRRHYRLTIKITVSRREGIP
jgi:hypothetical protein